jgi:2-polyprenyl-3-methyl-5-hydroxy-6-metoxy-1,4-benzoquinol methylase
MYLGIVNSSRGRETFCTRQRVKDAANGHVRASIPRLGLCLDIVIIELACVLLEEGSMTDKQSSGAARVWNERFSVPEFIFGTEPNAYLSRQERLLKPGLRALAVADGEGRNSVWLAKLGLKVDAFDISSVAIDKARKLAHDAAVEVNYQVCDCDAWNRSPAPYDLVVAIFIQFADPALRCRLFERMAQALKPGGLLILQGYTPRQLEFNTGGPRLLEKLYTEALLRQEFSSLQILELEVYEAELREGARHVGPSALVGMIGRRT